MKANTLKEFYDGRWIAVGDNAKYARSNPSNYDKYLKLSLIHIFSENPVPVKILGIPDENVVHGSSSEIFAHYGLDAPGIVKTALDFLK